MASPPFFFACLVELVTDYKNGLVTMTVTQHTFGAPIQRALAVGVRRTDQNGVGNAEALTNSADRSSLKRGMPRNRGLRSVARIHPDVVTATLVVEEAAMFAQMTLEFPPLYAERRREAASCRSSFAREVRSARTASCAIRNASSIVSASVTRSGSTGLVTTNPPSSAVVSVSTILPSETVYDLATDPL